MLVQHHSGIDVVLSNLIEFRFVHAVLERLHRWLCIHSARHKAAISACGSWTPPALLLRDINTHCYRRLLHSVDSGYHCLGFACFCLGRLSLLLRRKFFCANDDFTCRMFGTVILNEETSLGAAEMRYSGIPAILTPEAVLYCVHSFELSSFSCNNLFHFLSISETPLPCELL